MSQCWRHACIGVLCAMIVLAMVSVSAGEERVQKSRPRVELSAGTWISVGDTRWAHDASSVAGQGNPTSKLTYKDVGTNVIDLTGKFWFTPRVFGRLNGGFADIGGGRLTDDDFGSNGGQRLFSRTNSNLSGDSMWYLNADSGFRVAEYPYHRGWVEVFGGYQFWHTTHQSTGLTQVACDPGAIPALPPCAPAGTSGLEGENVISNTTNWHSIRVGASTEYRLTRRLSVIGTAAFIPLSIIDNKDIHHLRTSGPDAFQQNPSISMLGFGIGADADLGARFMFTKNIGLNVGYRVWWNHAVDGKVTFHGVSGSAEYPLVQFDSLRHGPTAGINFTF